MRALKEELHAGLLRLQRQQRPAAHEDEDDGEENADPMADEPRRKGLEPEPAALSFGDLISRVAPDGACAAGALEDISVHLCFICVLHLANEHGLRLDTGGRLDALRVHVPEQGGQEGGRQQPGRRAAGAKTGAAALGRQATAMA